MKYWRDKSAGDTIVEVILATALIAAAIGLAYSMSNRNLSNGVSAGQRSQALSLAGAQIERLKNAYLTSSATLNSYKIDKPFCILSDGSEEDVNRTASKCANFGSSPYSVTINYDKNTLVFTTNVNWSSSSNNAGQDQLTLYYKLSGDITPPPPPPPPPPQPSPTVSLSASPNSVAYGGSATLSWTTTNASSCTASSNMPAGNWSSGQSNSGGVSTGVLTSNQTYSLACTGAGGSNSANQTVIVAPPNPVLSFWADSNSVAYGSGTTLHWRISAGQSDWCWGSGGTWGGGQWKTKSGGDEPTGALTSNQTYNLYCGNSSSGYQTPTQTVAVAVGAPPQYTLTIVRKGSGGGSVYYATGKNCPNTACTITYTAGTPVSLFANADGDSRLASPTFRSDVCNGNNPCNFIIQNNTTVQANFVCRPEDC